MKKALFVLLILLVAVVIMAPSPNCPGCPPPEKTKPPTEPPEITEPPEVTEPPGTEPPEITQPPEETKPPGETQPPDEVTPNPNPESGKTPNGKDHDKVIMLPKSGYGPPETTSQDVLGFILIMVVLFLAGVVLLGVFVGKKDR